MMRSKALGARVEHGPIRRQHSLYSCPACPRRALPSSSTVERRRSDWRSTMSRYALCDLSEGTSPPILL